jgi:DNA-3-methyladenine glycosylase II
VIEERAGTLPWYVREGGFRGLLRTICGQQVSHQAANAIWRRLSAIPGALDPDKVAAAGRRHALRPGRADAAAGGACAGRWRARSHPGSSTSPRCSGAGRCGGGDADRHPRPGALDGRGASVLSEGRPDVFPAGDIALAAGLAHALGLEARPDPKALRQLSLAWAPWRSIAARLLWHHWLFATGRPVLDVEDGLPGA